MKNFLVISVVSAFILILGLLATFNQLSKPVTSEKDLKYFTVNQGDGVFSIASRLEKNKYIHNKYIFIISAYLSSIDKKLQAGSFRISPGMNVQEIVSILSKSGSLDYWLKVKEGLRVEEIANLVASQSGVSRSEYLSKAARFEGSLFPDSYLLPQAYTANQITETMTAQFNQKFSEAKSNQTTKLSDKEVLIIASLLEREAKNLESRQKVAGIIQNRLQIDMPLQIDATVQYSKDSLAYNKNPNFTDFWEPILKKDLTIKSAYNTYLVNGLPPFPICNPGFDSIYAAFHPTNSEYLFYITGNDGKMYYAKTLSEHNQNIANYLN